MPERRFFFGLYPDRLERDRLHALTPARLRGGRRVVADNLHVTVVYLGLCDADQETAARDAAESVCAGPVELTLDRIAVWHAAQVQVLLPPGTPAALRWLYESLRGALVARGFPPEARPWVPHITVARKIAAQPTVTIPPVRLRFSEFCLFRSHRVDGELLYEPIARWALTGGAGA
ncbi:MAG: RNA 2',3'-cyclic phosphodiesterase [Aquisalimonadaceae bacterium]